MASEGIGLYVHVPYCLKKCSYCAFASIRKPDDISGMCTALHAEFLERTRHGKHTFRTFYAGGGTPTLLPPEFWERFIGKVRSPYLKEVTIESNPAVLDDRGYSTLLLAGFNRISLGVQSFSDAALKRLGRVHSADQARDSLKLIRKTGFTNISTDLIYGFPDQTLRQQRQDLEEILTFMPSHISLYELTLEKGTPMGEAGKKATEELCVDMYHQAHELLTGNGYRHYEVSSYALEDKFVSQHNSAYWNRIPYMGIGPSAHSFDGTRRTWNHGDAVRYETAVIRGESPEESGEDLTGENGAHEVLALGFRHSGGVDLDKLRELGFALDPEKILETGMVTRIGNRLIPDEKGMLFADSLALKAAELLEELDGV
jgi:oxygen-independent coproporphyrinogen-3 oxidase